MMPNSAGLYFGVDFVDLVVLGSAKGSPQILKSIRTFLFDGVLTSDKRDRTQALPAAIQKIFDSIKSSVGVLNVGLPPDEVMVRHFNMPYIPEAERPNAVKFEAQKYLPFKLDDTISDFYITEEIKTTKDMGVLFAAINKDAVGRYSSLLKYKGIKLSVFDVTSVALLRVLSAVKKLIEDQTQVVVYLEKDIRASVIIAKDKNVYLAREVGASASKSALLETVLNNIRLSIDYYKRETKEVVIREIILCGDGELSEFEIYLKENISGIPVTQFNLYNELPGLNDLSRKQLIAVGLAMASFEKPRPKINLLGQSAKKSLSKNIEEYKPLIIEGVALFLVLTIMQVFTNTRLDAVKKKMARTKEEKVASAKGVMPDTPQEELSMMEARVKTQIEFLKTLAGENRFFLTKKLNTLGILLPPRAWIESFQFTDEIERERSLNIKGMVYSEEKNEVSIANEILSEMKKSKDLYLGFEDIRLASLEKVQAYNEEVLVFMVKCVGKPLKSSGLFTETPPAEAGGT